jgi:hypothetical protein
VRRAEQADSAGWDWAGDGDGDECRCPWSGWAELFYFRFWRAGFYGRCWFVAAGFAGFGKFILSALWRLAECDALRQELWAWRARLWQGERRSVISKRTWDILSAGRIF